MTDQKSVVAEEKAVETDTTQTSSPQVEESITEAETTQEEVVDQSSSSESTDDLPGGSENWAAEQRRAFQEQRQEIKRLKEQVSTREESESAFKSFRPQTPPTGQLNVPRVENYQDPYTGETNWTAYNQAVAQREQNVLQQARFEAQQTTQDVIDENNARNRYPELFKDRETEQEIADKWFAAKMRGENPTITQIADRVAKRYGKAVSKAEKIGADKALTEVSEKEQAGLIASGQTSTGSVQAASSEELADLSYKTRRGDYDAITTRISKIPWANK
jgi:hypothetical protein